MFSKSLLSELIKLALPDVLHKFASITTLQHQENGSSDDIIALKGQENVDQVCKLYLFFIWKKDFG
jgi:hypothetical protein